MAALGIGVQPTGSDEYSLAVGRLGGGGGGGGGPTSADGGGARLTVGDVVVAVGGLCVRGLGFRAVVARIKAAPRPLQLTSSLTPFGMNMGTQVNTWQFWTPGTPAAAKFAIKGADTCKLSSKCQSPNMQAHRARRGNLHTFYKYMDA